MRARHGEKLSNFLIIFSIFCNKFGSVRFGSVRFDRTELQNELYMLYSGYEDDEFFSVDRFEPNRTFKNETV